MKGSAIAFVSNLYQHASLSAVEIIYCDPPYRVSRLELCTATVKPPHSRRRVGDREPVEAAQLIVDPFRRNNGIRSKRLMFSNTKWRRSCRASRTGW